MPLFEDARLQPFLNQAGDARVADPMLQESYEPCLVNTIEEALYIGVQYPVHLPIVDCNHQSIQPSFGPRPG